MHGWLVVQRMRVSVATCGESTGATLSDRLTVACTVVQTAVHERHEFDTTRRMHVHGAPECATHSRCVLSLHRPQLHRRPPVPLHQLVHSSRLHPVLAHIMASASPIAPSSLSADQVEGLVYDRFMQYSGFGAREKAGEIDSALFAKLCKETGIVSKTCTKTDVDLVFTRAKPKGGGRKLNYTQFTTALLYLGEKRFPKVFKVRSTAASPTVEFLLAWCNTH
jgi:hypothetical protein